MKAHIIGRKRITALSQSLIRLEYSPDSNFEERRSIVAYEKQEPVALKDIKENPDWTILSTEKLEILIKK